MISNMIWESQQKKSDLRMSWIIPGAEVEVSHNERQNKADPAWLDDAAQMITA